MIDRSSRHVEISTEIDAPPEIVFRYLTDPERFSRWLGAKVELDPRPGGAVRLHFEAYETVVTGEIRELVPARRFAMTWGVESGSKSEGMPPGTTEVVISLEPIGEGTRVTLRHTGLPSEAERRDHEEGWRGYLERLREEVAGGA